MIPIKKEERGKKQVSFREFEDSANKIITSSLIIPREGNIDRVFELIDGLKSDDSWDHKSMKIGSTAYSHVIHLARELELINDDKSLTKRGKAAASLSHHGKLTRMSLCLEDMAIFKLWKEWSDVDSVLMLKPDSAFQFLNSTCKDLEVKTKKSRSTFLKRLLRDVLPHHPNRIYDDGIDERDEEFHVENDEPVFGDNVIDVIDRIKHGKGTVRISTGWMTANGYDLVARNLSDAKMKILLGADDTRGKAMLESPLAYFKHSVNSGPQSESKKAKHMRLYKELLSGTKRVKELNPKILDRLHAKGYFFGINAGLPSSANLTFNGLRKNVESGKVTTCEEDMRFFIERFESFFEIAEEITTEIVDVIEESWIFQDLVNPYFAYLRSLIELFGNISGKHHSESYKLADFQEMIVASTIHSLNTVDGALLVSPTGTGKTVMGTYIASVFSAQNYKVVIFAPNKGVKAKWEDMMYAFGQLPFVMSHTDIQKMNSDEKIRRKMASIIDENTLIIIDEAHKFRTEGIDGTENLRSLLSISGDEKPAKLLLLTATPVGVGFENVSTLHSMLNVPTVENMNQIASTTGIVNITLKFIMKRFGCLDDEGNRFLMFAEKKKYFAKRTQAMSFYSEGNEMIYDAIKKLKLTRLTKNESFFGKGSHLTDWGLDTEPTPEFVETENMGLTRLGLAQAVNSSKSAILDSISNAIQNISSMDYSEPEETRSNYENLRNMVHQNYDDRKYDALLDYLSERQKEKCLIFVQREATRKELVERLSNDLGKIVEEHTGTETQKAKKRERFAPIAHKKKVKKKNQIDILVSTDNLSEGFDLQDASIIVDYDLWWTPLKLQQRMGRLDRPTDKPRSFEVMRFVNTAPCYTDLVKIDERLSSRSILLKKLIGDGAYEASDNRDWEITENEDLGIITARTKTLEELGNSELSQTSNHIADLANAKKKDIDFAKKLPIGFVSSRKSSNFDGTYCLIKIKGQLFQAMKNRNTNKIEISPGDSSSEKMLSYIRVMPDEELGEQSEDHYDSVKEIVDYISEIQSVDAFEDVSVIFSSCVSKN